MPRRGRLLAAALWLLLALCSPPHAARAEEEAAPGPKPIKLTVATIDAQLQALPEDSYLLIELFAPWCPVCQRFRPHIERIAARFNGPPDTPLVRVATVDCVAQAALCSRYRVQGYPTLRFAHPREFLGAGQGDNVDGAPREADAVLRWINARLHTEWTWEAPAAVAPAAAAYPPPPETDPFGALTADAADVADDAAGPRLDLGDVELATVLAFEFAAEGGLLTESRRADFVAWLALLADAHPVPACRAGAGALGGALGDAWPAGADAPAELRRFRPCGVDRPRPDGWGACAGSSPDTRGYSCGLWTLLHGLAARVDSDHGGAQWLEGARAFVGSFFTCDDCSRHFMERTSAPDIGALRAGGGAPRAAASLWAWRVHNEVNARLAAEEALGGGGDPAHPKRAWPPAELCPACVCAKPQGCARTWPGAPGGAMWDEAAVERFLLRFYGAAPGEAAAAASWDPFGLGGASADGGTVGAAAVLDAAPAARAARKPARGGRAADLDDVAATTLELRMHAAPGGLRPLTFVLLCAAAPVGAYAGCVALAAGRRPGKAGKPARSLLTRALSRLLRRGAKGVALGRSAKEV